MVTTTFDISEITDTLITALKAANTASPMWVSNKGPIPNFFLNITNSSPETMRSSQQGDCQLSLYLMHVARSPFMRNMPILGTSAMANTQQPLALDLTYLLTAFSGDNADREQQAMTIALHLFHEQPIAMINGQALTVTIGPDTLDEMSRLWQSFTCAYRLSAVVRVGVVLLTPSQPPGTASPPPKIVDIAVTPADVLPPSGPRLFGVSRTAAMTIPAGDASPDLVRIQTGPLTAVAGAVLRVAGSGLSGAAGVFMTTLDEAQVWTVTGWRITAGLDAELVLGLPNAYAIPPAVPDATHLPPPGVYLLAVGADAASRGPSIPVTVAPRFDNVFSPPLSQAVAGVYTIAGAGFIANATQLYLGATALTPTSTPPVAGAGTFFTAADGSTITFTLPPGQPPGLTTIRVRVDGVDAPPVWQLVAP